MQRAIKIAVIRLVKQYHGESYKPPTRGKLPTKGFKQIVQENAETVKFYRLLITAVTVLRPILSYIFVGELCYNGLGSIMSYVFIPLLAIFILGVMVWHGKPLYSAGHKLIDPGYDLNRPGGYGDVLKDLIILLVLTHALSVSSPVFWCILLLLVVRALHVLWKYILHPFFLNLTRDDDSQNNNNGKKIKKPKASQKFKYKRTIKHWHHFR